VVVMDTAVQAITVIMFELVGSMTEVGFALAALEVVAHVRCGELAVSHTAILEGVGNNVASLPGLILFVCERTCGSEGSVFKDILVILLLGVRACIVEAFA